MKNCVQCVRMFALMTLLTGLLYPMLITVIALITMHERATGHLVFVSTKPVGSHLIAQKFTSETYFWSRPSAVDYNPIPSGGSNLGPTSATLRQAVRQRQSMFVQADRVEPDQIPPELLFASASGLDPHISPESAYFQMYRIASARNLKIRVVEQLIRSMTEAPLGGFLGPTYVNVLALNIALDKLKPEAAQ